MLCLGLDTALGACSVALVDEAKVVARLGEAMTTGQAEALAPMADRLMREAGRRFADIDRIAVTTGPGTFTGQRIGLAFARGLALALKVPCVGVTTLEVMASAARADHPGQSVLVASDARKGEAYVLGVAADGAVIGEPELLTLERAAERARMLGQPVVLAGTAAEVLAPLLEGAILSAVRQPDAAFVAGLGMTRDPSVNPPTPLYLRPPDAKLPGPLKPLPAQRRRP